MKNSSRLNTIHYINVIISIGLIVLSIISLFYINEEPISYHEDSKELVYIFRLSMSLVALAGAVAVLIIGLLPSDDRARKGRGKALSASATLTSSDTMEETKYVHGVWNWIGAFIILCSLALLGLSLLNFSLGYDVFDITLLEIINICFSTNLYNKLALFMFLGMLFLCIFSIVWRVIADKQYKNDEYWLKQPIFISVMALVIFGLLIIIPIYFHLKPLGIFILYCLVFVILGSMDDLFDDPINGMHNIKRIFKRGLDKKEFNNIENSDSKKLTFEEGQTVGKLQYFYDFGDLKAKKELTDYNQFSEELECFRNAQKNKDFSKLQPVVNVWIKDNNINGITMISAFYDLRKGLFTKKIKSDEFFVALHRINEDGHKVEYSWTTKDYDEFKRVFYEFIVNQRTPDLSAFAINF